jgi:hypothetical protein
MRVASLILSLLIVVQAPTRADDLDIIVAPHSTPQARGDAYNRLETADFLTIGWKLANCIDTHPASPLIGVGSDKPWLAEYYRVEDRISMTLSKLWFAHMDREKTVKRSHGLMLELLDNDFLTIGKLMALNAIPRYLNWPRGTGGADSIPDLPTPDIILAKLDRIVRDEKQYLECRRKALEIIFKYGDPSNYVEMAVNLASSEPTALKKAEAFRMSTQTESSRFSEEGRKKYVRHCFEYLEIIDDHHHGHGYFLALRVGDFLGIPPVRAGQGSFSPDQTLPKYQGTNGLNEDFSQDTVNNAMKWWAEHKGEY